MSTIEYVTHASVLFRHNNVALLTDPFYWFDPLLGSIVTHFPPRDLQPEDFGSLQFLYSSHSHPDHSHPHTLGRLKSQVGTVLLPAERPTLLKRFQEVGFDDIRLLQNGQTVELAGGLKVTSYWSDYMDTCLVVETDDFAALHMNDCLPSMELSASIGQRHKLDVAFVLYTSAQDLYPFLLPYSLEKLQSLSLEREIGFVAGQIERLKRLAPRRIVPYSMTMTWYQPADRHFNTYNRCTPATFGAAVEAALPDCRCVVMQPGEVLDMPVGTLSKQLPGSAWGESLEQWLANIDRYLETAGLPVFDRGRIAEVSVWLEQKLQRLLQQDHPDSPLYRLIHTGVKLQVEGEDGQATFFVDFDQRRLRRDGDFPTAAMDVHVPASLIAAVRDGESDPHSLLYTLLARFRLHAPVEITPHNELRAYVMTWVFLMS